MTEPRSHHRVNDDLEEELLARLRERQTKDRMTTWHQRMTVFGFPLVVTLIGWVAVEFDGLRINMVKAQDEIAAIDKRLDIQGASIKSIWDKIVLGSTGGK